MPAEIAIIHGWSDSSKSFGALKAFLEENGYETTQIWLGDYVSLDDDVRIEDVAKRMQSVVLELIDAGKLAAPFDLVVHSTGGLVAREWISRYYPDGAGCPAKRFIMLAPANFGSRLASLGKSMIGRIFKGWNNWFQTGEEMLKALELASPYQWSLTRRDLLDPSGSSAASGPYGHGKVWPFVITGSRSYSSGLRQMVNENGSDGTVRAAAANLNTNGVTIDFSSDHENPTLATWSSRLGAARIPYAILPDRDHSLIIKPAESLSPPEAAVTDSLGELILDALRCENDQAYSALHESWLEANERVAALADAPERIEALFPDAQPESEAYHQYMQFIVYARDDHGQPVDDYFLEFFAPKPGGDRNSVYFHSRVLEHVHTNTVDASYRCFFLDRSDLITGFYGKSRKAEYKRLAMGVSAAEVGPNVRYFDKTREGARGHVLLHDADQEERAQLEARLHRNSTHLIELILPRQPTDKVFRLSV